MLARDVKLRRSMLNATERETLAQICETLVPPVMDPRLQPLGELTAAKFDLSGRTESALAAVSDPVELRQVRLFLRVLQNPLVNAIMSGHLKRFSAMRPVERETVLLSWATSRIGLRRMAFQGLKRLSLFLFYATLTDQNPELSEQAFQYRVPVGPDHDQDDRIIPVTPPIDGDLECDVVVVGSGAGGAVAAAECARAGLSVIVIEKGGYFDRADYHGRELQANEEMFENKGALTTRDLGFVVLAGSTLGGGTVINWSTSLPTPRAVRSQWQEHYGFLGAAGEAYERSTQAVLDRLHVDLNESEPNPQNALLERGAQRLSIEATAIPRNVKKCVECDFCLFGCRYGAKQDALQTYLRDAYARGAKIMVHTTADQVLIRDGRAQGIRALVETDSGRRELEIRSRAVIVAAGSLHSPLLLHRSGLRNRQIGKNLRLHPVTASFGRYDSPIRSWEGPPQTRLVDNWSDLDGQGYGVRLEVAPAHPGLWASSLPWTSGRSHKELMSQLENLANVIVITRDHGSGTVRSGRAQRPILDYELNPRDAQHLMHGLIQSIRIHAMAGARQIFSPHVIPLAWERGADLETFIGQVRARGLGANQTSLFSAHQLGTCRISADPQLGALKPSGETHEVKNLFVADGSVFPTPCGVNPMVPIAATSHFLTQGILRELV